MSELGGVGSIITRATIAKQLFPYKHGLPVPNNFDLDKSDRNTETSITAFTSAESTKLERELHSRRRWYVDGILVQDRTIRASDCERRVAPSLSGGKVYCEKCTALYQDEGLQRELQRVSTVSCTLTFYQMHDK